MKITLDQVGKWKYKYPEQAVAYQKAMKMKEQMERVIGCLMQGDRADLDPDGRISRKRGEVTVIHAHLCNEPLCKDWGNTYTGTIQCDPESREVTSSFMERVSDNSLEREDWTFRHEGTDQTFTQYIFDQGVAIKQVLVAKEDGKEIYAWAPCDHLRQLKISKKADEGAPVEIDFTEWNKAS